VQPALPTAPGLVVLVAAPPPQQRRRQHLTGRAPAPRSAGTPFIIPNGPCSSRPPDPRNAGARRPGEAALRRDRSAVWLRSAAVGLCALAAAAAAVSFTAQYRMAYADRRLALEAGIDASIGSTTPSWNLRSAFTDRAFERRGPRRGLADFELATAEYVNWFNIIRLHRHRRHSASRARGRLLRSRPAHPGAGPDNRSTHQTRDGSQVLDAGPERRHSRRAQRSASQHQADGHSRCVSQSRR